MGGPEEIKRRYNQIFAGYDIIFGPVEKLKVLLLCLVIKTGPRSPTCILLLSNMSAIWKPAPEPATKLGVYRVLSPQAGLRVSPICLGAMSIGDKWNEVIFLLMCIDVGFDFLS